MSDSPRQQHIFFLNKTYISDNFLQILFFKYNGVCCNIVKSTKGILANVCGVDTCAEFLQLLSPMDCLINERVLMSVKAIR